MPKVYTWTVPVRVDLLDAFCALQENFTDQFVYYRKDAPVRYLGLGRCTAVGSVEDVDVEVQGPEPVRPAIFSFARFDPGNPRPADDLFGAFPRLRFMLPEVVLLEGERGACLQVNSLGPVYPGRVDRFLDRVRAARPRIRRTIPFSLEADDPSAWTRQVEEALGLIESGRLDKVVLSQRERLVADEPFSAVDLLVNLVDGPARGTAFLYGYGGVFFCGCTPELLVRGRGGRIESMCLAGTAGVGRDPGERERLARGLLADGKNLREHRHVVDFVRQVLSRGCHDVDVPDHPGIMELPTVQHLCTPVRASMLDGGRVQELAAHMHPTPALSGAPVGEALVAIRRIEGFDRGLFGGTVGVVDDLGDGEFSVAIRCGVFDGVRGWVFAGCGIVAGSRASAERDEIRMKLGTILSAFDGTARPPDAGGADRSQTSGERAVEGGRR